MDKKPKNKNTKPVRKNLTFPEDFYNEMLQFKREHKFGSFSEMMRIAFRLLKKSYNSSTGISQEKLDYVIELTEEIRDLTISAFQTMQISAIPDLKRIILEKLKMYQPVDIIYLSILTKVEGRFLYNFLGEMEREGLVELTESYEWVIKDQII